jgi:hypothetical protein
MTTSPTRVRSELVVDADDRAVNYRIDTANGSAYLIDWWSEVAVPRQMFLDAHHRITGAADGPMLAMFSSGSTMNRSGCREHGKAANAGIAQAGDPMARLRTEAVTIKFPCGAPR